MTAASDRAVLHAFVGTPKLEGPLAAELPAGMADGPRWPGVISCRREPPLLDPAFAFQRLPAAHHLHGDSVRALVEAAEVALVPKLLAAGDTDAESPFTVHAYVPDEDAYGSLAGRADLLGQAFLERLRERRRKLWRRHRVPTEMPLGVGTIVQLALVGRTALLASAASPRPLPTGGFDLAPWPGGLAPVAEDRRAPSRAYRKLVEGFAWMGRQPGAGEVCVDLGGSPGGWAWTALKRGARVVAVDRAALAAPAAGHPQLTEVRGNAFTYQPPTPVDWLLCDVICEPQRTVQLCERWMDAGFCRSLCASLKFKGARDYQLIAEARARLSTRGWSFLRLKHLRNHHNEVAILAYR